MGGGGPGVGWGGPGGCERRIVVFSGKFTKEKNRGGGVWGGGGRFGGGFELVGVRVDVNEELKFL